MRSMGKAREMLKRREFNRSNEERARGNTSRRPLHRRFEEKFDEKIEGNDAKGERKESWVKDTSLTTFRCDAEKAKCRSQE